MKIFVTSCKRHDLLSQTLKSLPKKAFDELIIHEDSWQGFEDLNALKQPAKTYKVNYLGGKGQINSIVKFSKEFNEDYYFHCEDDWLFSVYNDFLYDSMEILKSDPSIIKVLSKAENVHHTTMATTPTGLNYEVLLPTSFYGNEWYGFSWNPGVTNFGLLNTLDLQKSEKDISLEAYNKNYKVAYLSYRYYTHLGNLRSTR